MTGNVNVNKTVAAIRQAELDKRVNFENSFAYLVPVCPVAAKGTKKTKVSFDVNVSGAAGGIKSPGGGLGGGNSSPGKGESGVSLRYHTHTHTRPHTLENKMKTNWCFLTLL